MQKKVKDDNEDNVINQLLSNINENFMGLTFIQTLKSDTHKHLLLWENETVVENLNRVLVNLTIVSKEQPFQKFVRDVCLCFFKWEEFETFRFVPRVNFTYLLEKSCQKYNEALRVKGKYPQVILL